MTCTSSWCNCRLACPLRLSFCAATGAWNAGWCPMTFRKCKCSAEGLAGGVCGCLDDLLHLAYGSLHAYQHGSRDNAVPDIQLFHARNTADGHNVGVVESMSQVDLQAVFTGKSR